MSFLLWLIFMKRNYRLSLLRLFNTVGPRQSGQYGMVVPRFVQQALLDHPITVYGDGKQSRCFGYVGDIVGAIVKLMDNDKCIGQIYNIGSNEEISINDLAKRLKISQIVNPRSNLFLTKKHTRRALRI